MLTNTKVHSREITRMLHCVYSSFSNFVTEGCWYTPKTANYFWISVIKMIYLYQKCHNTTCISICYAQNANKSLNGNVWKNCHLISSQKDSCLRGHNFIKYSGWNPRLFIQVHQPIVRYYQRGYVIGAYN